MHTEYGKKKVVCMNKKKKKSKNMVENWSDLRKCWNSEYANNDAIPFDGEVNVCVYIYISNLNKVYSRPEIAKNDGKNSYKKVLKLI